MRKILDKFLELLNFGRRDGMILLLALLLAFSVWLIHKLSLEYSVYLRAEVVAVSNIDEHSDHSTTGVEVMARCRTTGGRILYAYFTRDNVVKVKFPSSILEHESDDRYSISTDRLHEYAGKIFGSNVKVESFVSDKVYFRFQKEECRNVAIKPVSSLSFEDQYMALGEMVVEPASVKVYGDKVHVEELDYVKTATIKHASINESISGMISLTSIPGMRFSVDEVHYRMEVVRCVEVEQNDIPIEIINVPEDRTFITEPSHVDVVLKCEFPLKSDMHREKVRLQVDYKEFESSISGNVVVKVKSKPFGTISCEVSPFYVKMKEVE